MRRRPFCFLSAFALCLSAAFASAQAAPTPPLGWNSWDSYALTITEAQFKDNLAWFHQHLQPHGYQYLVVDEGWYLAHPENAGSGSQKDQGYTLSADGRYHPARNRFPSSANGAGFKPLADSVHALGLKFGIHILRGIPRQAVEENLPIAGSRFHAQDAADTTDKCEWNPDNYGIKNNVAGQAYYDSIAKLYAGWGVDYVKIDCIAAPYRKDEIHMFSKALRDTGRNIVLSLSPGPTPLSEAEDVSMEANLWRISGDVWDIWDRTQRTDHDFPQSLRQQFAVLAKWAPYRAANRWPDPDMLPIGYLGPVAGWGKPRQSNLTAEEQRTLITLWSISRSPLIAGANLTRMDAATEALLTNDEVLAVDQHSADNHQALELGDLTVWTAKAADGTGIYVGFFNTGDSRLPVNLLLSSLGMQAGAHRQRDLWQHKDLQAADAVQGELAPHAALLVKVSR